MKKRTLIPCFILLLFSSCNHTAVERTFDADTVIKIDHKSIDKKVIEHASDYVEEIQYIPLETNDEYMIGELTRVVLTSRYIYIYDWQTNNLYQFNHSGKYIRNISRQGEGPHEYMRISSFSVDPETENVTIYCEIKQSLLEFTPEGLPVGEKKIGFIGSQFIYYKNGYLFYGGRLPNQNLYKDIFPEQYRLVMFEQREKKEEYLPFTYNESLLRTTIASDRNCLYVFNNKVRLIERCNYVVYEIDKGVSPVYAIDFGKYTIPVHFYSDNEHIDQQKIEQIEESDYCELSSFFETDSYIYIYYSVSHYDHIVCSSIYSKKENKSINIGPIWVNDIDHIGMPKIIGTYENAFVGYYDAYDLNTMIITNTKPLTEAMRNLGETIKDSDNPILCIVKMKD